MLTIHINGNQYYLPENEEELSLKKYIELSKVEETNKTLASAHVLSMLMECDLQLILDCEISQFSDLCARINFIYDIQKNPTLKDEVMIDEIKYFVKTNFNKITVGEMSDIELISENKNSIDNFPFVIASLIKEESAPFKTTIEKADIILEKMSVGDALAIVFFFTDGAISYMKNISSSLSKSKKKKVVSKKK